MNTTTFKRFSTTHEELGQSLKLIAVGLCAYEDTVVDSPSLEELWARLGEKGRSWGTKPHSSLISIERAYNFAGSSGVVLGYSAFDAFLSATSNDLKSWASGTQSAPFVKAPTEETASLKRVYEEFQFDLSKINFLAPIFTYLRLTRNCLVHNNGIADKNLSDACADADLRTALQNWVQETGEHGPLKLKTFWVGSRIELEYFHGILASSILRLIALDIDQHVLQTIGTDGIVYLAAMTMLEDCNQETFQTTCRSAPSYIAEYVSRVNRHQDVSKQYVEPLLKRQGILEKCTRAFRFATSRPAKS